MSLPHYPYAMTDAGFFLGWLTLATANRDKEFGQWQQSAEGS